MRNVASSHLDRRTALVGAAVGLALAATPRFGSAAVRPRLFDSHAHLISVDKVKYPPHPLGGAPLRAQDFDDPVAVDRLLREMAANNVVRGLAVQRAHIYGYDNNLILDESHAHPDKLRPVVVLDAQAADTPARLRTMVRGQDVAGLRITSPGESAGLSWINSPAALATWAVANELGMPMIVMLVGNGNTEPGLAAIKTIAESHPNVPIVLDHCGWPPVKGAPDYGAGPAWLALRPTRNVFFKVTTINFEFLKKAGIPTTGFVEHFVATFGANRMMWGSDIGQSQGRYADFVQQALDATARLSPKDRDAALFGTGARVFARRS